MPNKLDFSPPPSLIDAGFSFSWLKWFESVFDRVGSGPFKIRGYSVSNLPTVSDWGSLVAGSEFSSLIFIYDESGGAIPAFSDGTNWRRVTDRAIAT